MITLPVVLTLRQPDLGSGLILAAMGLGMMFLAGVSVLYFAAGAAGLWALAPVAWSQLHDYQRRRIEIFLDPDKDPLGAGYHITQSKIALGAGGVTGKGYMLGTQSQLDFLPEKHTDFIFTMFAEEWGVFGAIALLALYAVLLALLVVMVLRARTWFARLIIAGTAVMLFLYVAINVAMVTGLVPVVGVPLPFISYGGTHMATLMACIGLGMSADVHRREALRTRRSVPLRRRIRYLTSVWTWRVAGARGSRLGPDGPVLPS
jgi:rod shape determining protein RodA